MSSQGHVRSHGAGPEPPPGEAARDAWALLAAVFFSRRSAWVASAANEGLTPPAAMALMKLGTEEAPPLSRLAGLLRCDASYVTSIADRLEERGFAERRTDPGDRRVRTLVLTRAGAEAQARVRGAFLEPPAALAELGHEDVAALRRIAGHLLAAGGEEVREGLALAGRPLPDEATADG
jgi:DNA-binding MarR family transcriptional regulator